MVETGLFSYDFSEDDLKNLKLGMEQSLNALNTSEKKKICLEYEIATVETVIALKNMISELGQLLNQENFSVDDYVNKLFAVSDYLGKQNIGKDLVLKAADLIERQKENCDDFTMEIIDEEVKEVKKIKQTAEQKPEDRIDFGRSGSVMMVQFHNNHINQFHMKNDAIVSRLSFGAVLYHLSDGFKQLQETVQQVHNRVKQMADNVMNTVSATFYKKQEQGIEEQSDSSPEKENKDTERNPDDIFSILMDNTGIQGYKDYFTIVPVSKLDFHVQLTYEMEQQQEKQNQEQEISEEKTLAPECRKKQVEYDDL